MRAFSSVGLEHLIDIEKVTGSNPVMPIRQNKKKWGRGIVMSVCLMQPNRFAVNSDSQRNLGTCSLDKECELWYNIV